MLDEATKQVAMTALRTVLIAFGGILTAKGWVSAEDVQLYIGFAMMVAPALWALYASATKVMKADERESQALNAGIQLSNGTAGFTPPVAKADAKVVIEAVKAGALPVKGEHP